MAEVAEIELTKLRFIVNRLLDHAIETRGVETVPMDQNYYWDVSSEQLYDMSKDVEDLMVGSLYDEWEFLASVLDDTNPPVAELLTKVAPILRYVGEYLGDRLAKFGG